MSRGVMLLKDRNGWNVLGEHRLRIFYYLADIFSVAANKSVQRYVPGWQVLEWNCCK